ncbi:hypothetical protein GCM10025777_19750 [Membranihabitans marinus]|nr:DUF2157 domain-containing protein [Membranihabitans marinus]
MSLQKDISELVESQIISQETADRINEYYKIKREDEPNRLFMAFGLLGAILVGLGIILIIGHNWDNLSKEVKSICSFLPLIIGQIFCGYVLLEKNRNKTWREGTAAFLFLSVAACLALIGQIYNIPSDLSSFLLTWLLLCLPLIYIMHSSLSSLFFILGITIYVTQTGFTSNDNSSSWIYLLLLFAVLPHYYQLYRRSPNGNFIIFHHWAIPISILFALGTISSGHEEWLWVSYSSLFALFYIIGNSDYFVEQKSRNNGYLILGALGTVILLLILSFDWFWTDLRKANILLNEIMTSPEFWMSAVITVLSLSLVMAYRRRVFHPQFKPLAISFIPLFITFIVGMFSSLSIVLINIILFAIGVFIIREGTKMRHLPWLNFGMLIIAALVTCRFLDSNLSFILRGLVFVGVGLGFFVVNYWMIKTYKAHEN